MATFTHAVGRRKTASATLRMQPAEKNSLMVNGKSAEAYFKTAERARAALAAFSASESAQNYAAVAHVEGGGITGQAEAVRHALARAISAAEPQTHKALKAAGLLTRDPRAKERKKPGLVKARKRKQWSKR
jgi:small subunit ribosomal protein S9